MKTAEKTTRTIAGHQITLEPGCRYVAGRPFAERGRKVYPVSIYRHTDGFCEPIFSKPDAIVTGLNLGDANELLAEFNDGPMSFDGRVW